MKRALGSLNTPLDRFVLVPLAFALGGALVVMATILAHVVDDTPPVTFHRVEAMNSPLREGQDLAVTIHRTKVRDDCPVTSLRYATNEDGRAFDIPDQAWAGGAIGDQLNFTYPTSGLPPGEYVLHVSLSYECPSGFTYNVDQPDVAFRVLP